MTVATMSAIWNALKLHLAIPVTRSWPQGTPALPGCTFRLLSWRRDADGTDALTILVLLRVTRPEDGDDFAEDAQVAMRSLGYTVIAATDELDEASGFFIRSLTFEGKEPSRLLPTLSVPGFNVYYNNFRQERRAASSPLLPFSCLHL